MDGNWLPPGHRGPDASPCPKKNKSKPLSASYPYLEVVVGWVHPGFLEVMDNEKATEVKTQDDVE